MHFIWTNIIKTVVLITHALHIDQQLKISHKIIQLNFNFLHFVIQIRYILIFFCYLDVFLLFLINLTYLKLNFVSIKY